MSEHWRGRLIQQGKSMKSIAAGALQLEPLTRIHAPVMFDVLADPVLYQYLDYGPPSTVEHVTAVYERLEARRSPDGTEQWLNWVVFNESGHAVGYVQATVFSEDRAWVAYLLGRRYWGAGIARAATGAMLKHLQAEHGVTQFLACVERANQRSLNLLQALGFEAASPKLSALHGTGASEVLLHRSKLDAQAA